ncbi:MAG: outer membrane beta-barrel family protein, partial [Bacteroidetes bacterium]|nr:outer membrane beta-barrel family protein [Bacteroidota bacterium]
AVRYGEFNSGWDRHLESKEWIVPDTTPVQYYLSEEDGPRRSKYFSTDLYFKQQLDTLGQKLEINVFLAGRDGNDEENTKEWISDASWNKQGDPIRYINTLEKENARQMQNKLDYTKPFRNNATLEAGLLTDHSKDNEDYIFGQIPASEIPDYSNKMKFRQDIYAAYLTFSHQLFGFEYLLGLRGEYTHRVITSEQAGLDYTIDQPDYFPSLHISRKLKKDHQLYTSYSRRIDRPGGRQLEPFTYYRDANNRWRGNPDLKPEYINSFELGWLKKWKGSFMSLEGFYKNTKNLISRVSEASEGTVITHTFVNLNQDHSLGGEAMISIDAVKWLSLNLMGSVYYYELDGELNGEPLNEFTTTWNTRMNAGVKLKSSTRFEIRTTYRGPTVTAQGSREGTFTADAAIRQDFLKRSLSAVLQVKDIFGTLKYEITSSEKNVFYERSRFTMEPQVVMLTLSYKFNNFQLRKDDMGDPGNSDSGMDISY